MTSPAIQLAIECGGHGGSVTMVFDIQELETFYTKAQAQALRDAADHCEKEFGDYGDGVTWYSVDHLRRMADELEAGK